jgi:hypothetical protein
MDDRAGSWTVVRREAAGCARAGLSGAAFWLALEFLLRDAGLLVVFLAGAAVGAAPDPGRIHALNVLLLAPTLALLAAVFRRRVRGAGLGPVDLGYRGWPWAAATGLAAGVVMLGIALLTARLEGRFVDTDHEHEYLAGLLAAGPWIAGLLIPLNGLLGPAVEEYAWRGYIQSRLVAAWGPSRGIAAAALCFALKHIVVNLSVTRALTLLVGAAALGIVGARWGTWASTGAHMAANLIPTVRLFLEALERKAWSSP